jgi:hypothetical protein
VVVNTPELCVGVYVGSRQGDFKPDPVCAFYSVRERVTVDRRHVVRWDVVVSVYRFVDAREFYPVT